MEPDGVFRGRALHLHVTGSVSACLVPWWVHWLRQVNPELVLSASVTRSAQRFVTVRALDSLTGGGTWIDDWDDPHVPREVHHGTLPGVDAIVVFPATLDTVMRLSQGRADSPAMLLLQVAQVPIVLADATPGTNAVIESHLEALAARPTVRFAPRVTAVRATTREEISSGFTLPGAIAVANDMLISKENGV